jgi:pyruvate-formate lyase
MTETVDRLYRLISTKGHHSYRRDLELDLAADFSKRRLPPVRRVAGRLAAVLAAERPVILEGERISFLRTVAKIPEMLTPEEWEAIKVGHFIHELGNVSNISPDYASTIALGLEARRDEASRRLAAADVSDRAEGADVADGAAFIEAVIIGIDALLNLTARYAAEARRIGREDIADVLERVPRLGARTFREALQSFRILHFALWCEGEYHNTVGRLDQYLFPYMKADIDAGRLDEEGAFDLLEEFFLSFNRDSDLYPGVQQGDNGQSVVLGGLGPDGEYSFNILSEMCLRASKELKLIDPKINLRVSSLTPPRVYALGTELTKEGLGFPQYCNDDVVIPGLEALGYSPEDARNYVVAACWEFIIPGRGMDITNIGALSFPLVVDRCLRRDLASSSSFESFMDCVRREIAAECGRMAEKVKNLWMIPAPFMSILIEGRIREARDVSLGAVYNNFGFHGVGLSTAVDSLAAVRKYLFEEGSLSADRLLGALDGDFAGEDELLARLRYEAPKMGNGDKAVDVLAVQLLGFFADALGGLRNERDGRFRAGTGSAMFYLWSAREMGASPDGRRKGEWFGANYSPSLFARVGGPLSVIKSFTTPDLKRTINGGPLTMEFHSTIFDDPESQAKVADLVRLFIARGGHEIQLNAVNRDRLLQAQAHPERFGNLIVRVWGWSAYFVELDREYQEHIIKRQEFVG